MGRALILWSDLCYDIGGRMMLNESEKKELEELKQWAFYWIESCGELFFEREEEFYSLPFAVRLLELEEKEWLK